MDPGQRDVRRHRSERDRVVPDTRRIPVGGPVIGDQLGLRGDSAEHKRVEFVLAKAFDHLQPGAPGLAAIDFDRATISSGVEATWIESAMPRTRAASSKAPSCS